MMKLTKTQREELERELRREDVRKYADRIRVILLLDREWSPTRIAEALFIDPATVHRYRNSYEEGGIEQLIADGYFGRRTMLSDSDLKELSQDLEASPRLSVKEIANHIESKYGKVYTISGLTDLLHRLGFSYKKPKRRPAKVDAELQEEFCDNLEILRENIEQDECIYFADSCHPILNSMPQYGWFKKGEKQTIFSSTGRTRHNIIGAVNIESLEAVVRSDETINANSVIKLMKALEQKHPEMSRIYLIVDNARYFHSHLVKDYVAEDSKIKLIYLPPYSPNLNPIERLWKFMHKKVLYNRYYSSNLEFKNKIVDFFRKLPKFKTELETLLTYNFEMITAS